MAKKEDKSLSLEYILAKQAENKGNLSSAVVKQLSAENIDAKSISVKGGDKGQSSINIVAELKRLNKSFTSMLSGISKIATGISNNNSLLKTLVANSSRKMVAPSKNDLTQQELETQDYQNRTMSLLEQLVSNTKPIKGKEEKGKFPWLTALALAALAAVAALVEWAKRVKDVLKFLTPESLKNTIVGAFKKIGTVFENIAKEAGNKLRVWFKPVEDFFKDVGSRLKKAFGFGEDGPMTKIMNSIRETIGKVKKVFRNANRMLKLFTTGSAFGSWFDFSFVNKLFSGFGKIAKKVGKIVKGFGKIFAPISWIIGIYDTVTGAIEGYKKEGVMGIFSGGLKGLLGNFVGSFFDLIKDIASWILEKLGFKNASKLLDSFSFEKMIKGFIDAVFHPINTIKDMFKKLAGWFKDFEIPAIGFSFLGKQFGAGPWHPFKSDENPIESPESNAVPPPSSQSSMYPFATPPVNPAAFAAGLVYDKSSQNAEAAMYPFATPPTNIVNAPTTISKQTQTNVMKVNVRDQDTSLKYYHRSRFTF